MVFNALKIKKHQAAPPKKKLSLKQKKRVRVIRQIEKIEVKLGMENQEASGPLVVVFAGGNVGYPPVTCFSSAGANTYMQFKLEAFDSKLQEIIVLMMVQAYRILDKDLSKSMKKKIKKITSSCCIRWEVIEEDVAQALKRIRGEHIKSESSKESSKPPQTTDDPAIASTAQQFSQLSLQREIVPAGYIDKQVQRANLQRYEPVIRGSEFTVSSPVS